MYGVINNEMNTLEKQLVSVSEYVQVMRREEEHIVERVPGAVMLEEQPG